MSQQLFVDREEEFRPLMRSGTRVPLRGDGALLLPVSGMDLILGKGRSDMIFMALRDIVKVRETQHGWEYCQWHVPGTTLTDP